MSTVGIIIPVFNAERYLRECLESICDQTFKDFETILVNDGSTDYSGRICDEYSLNDSRFKVIHKNNEGVSRARADGINAADSRYLCFVDADDTVLPNMLEDFITMAKMYDADIVQSTGYLNKYKREGYDSAVFNKNTALESLFSFGQIRESLCLGMYKTMLFRGVEIPFNIHYFEDFALNAAVVARSNCIFSTTQSYYYYRDNNDSATHRPVNQKTLSCLQIADYLRQNGVITNNRQYCDVSAYFLRHVFFQSIRGGCDSNHKKHINRAVRKNIACIIKSKLIPIKTKGILLLYCIQPRLAEAICRRIIKGL